LELTILIDDPSRRSALFGNTDRNLRLIRAAFDIRIVARDSTLRLHGPNDSVHQAAQVIGELQRTLRSTPHVSEEQVQDIIERVRSESGRNNGDPHVIDVFVRSAVVVPKGEGQRQYIQAIHESDLTLCFGPAGTGKTYLAVAVAVSMLRQQQIKRIVLVRPAVEAGEKLGYLPGDMQAKVNPYLRPLFDAMADMMSFEQLRRFVQNDVIEVVPLAFMRGRTLNHSVIILDEAQNATQAQMLMFLTRLGQESKMIVTGDESQSDLAQGRDNAFADAANRLAGVQGVSIVRLTATDIVRHPLVQRIVERYGDRK